MSERFGLRFRFALFFAALWLGGTAAIVLGLWTGYARNGGPPAGYVIAGVIAGFGLLALTAWIAFLFDENIARPILAMASELTTRAQTEIDTDIDPEPARYLGALTPAAGAVHTTLMVLRAQQARAIARETRRVARDKALLEALLRDLADGVVVITPDQRVMLYNRMAQNLLGRLGLDRALSTCLRTEPVRHALDRLTAHAECDPTAVQTFLTSTTDGARFLLGRAGAVLSEGTLTGYVLIFHDATEDIAAHRDHDHLFNSLLEGTRRPVAAISAALDVLQSDAEMPPELRQTFNASMQEEVDRLVARLREIGARHDEAITRHWPMSRVSSRDIFLGLKTRTDLPLQEAGPEEILTCDAFAVLELLGRMLAELAGPGTRHTFRFAAERQGDQVRLTLGWTGEEVSDGQLDRWLAAPLSPVYGAYSGRDALTTHRTEIWPEPATDRFRLVLPLAAATTEPLRPADERAEFYDFNLPASGGALDDRPLSELTFVVFDTETTGLSPRGGDEIVQIAGVRLVNGRILRGEVFDTLVNPGRAIPPGSTAVHGIHDAMVQNAPDIATAGRAFHDFCEGAVLVAHNAPFDMTFLRLKQDRIGRRFDHPVLCTVLLSAALFAHTGKHTLDALAERFGVDLPEETRHTALGDALATAEVFRHMLGVMSAEGIVTLGQALDAASQMTRIRKAQNY